MNLMEIIQQAKESEQLSSSTAANLRQWLETDELPEWVRDSLTELVQEEQWEELNDRFYKDITFGTGGMRGRTIGNVMTSVEKGSLGEDGAPERPKIGSNAMNDITVIRATMALYKYVSQYLEKSGRFETPTMAIAHDVRYFSRRFCLLAASVWNRLGGIALVFDGPRSTPQLSFTVRQRGAHAGIVITASHNPPHDNGFKAYFEDGAQVISPHAEGIVDEYAKITLNEATLYLDCSSEEIRTLPKEDDLEYLKVVEQAALDPDLIEQEKPKVVFTPIHGTGAISSLPALWELGLEPIVVDTQSEMHPGFPTVESPNPENAEALKQGISLARKTGAVAVIATDPDCDRMGVATLDGNKNYALLNGNEISALLAEYRITRMKEFGCLPQEGTKNATIIKTFVTTPLVECIAKGHGLNCINTLTGFKWAGKKIRDYEKELKEGIHEAEGIGLDFDKTDYYTRINLGIKYGRTFIFACEESYGYLPYDFVRNKDANGSIIAFCELLSYIKKNNSSVIEYLDQIYVKYGYFDQRTVNIYFEGAMGAQKIKNIVDSFSSDCPKSIDGHKIIDHKDFSKSGLKDEDGDNLPLEQFHVFTLENNYSVSVRASGTEPKIKFYVFGNEKIHNIGQLKQIKNTVSEELIKISEYLENDARTRADN